MTSQADNDALQAEIDQLKAQLDEEKQTLEREEAALKQAQDELASTEGGGGPTYETIKAQMRANYLAQRDARRKEQANFWQEQTQNLDRHKQALEAEQNAANEQQRIIDTLQTLLKGGNQPVEAEQ